MGRIPYRVSNRRDMFAVLGVFCLGLLAYVNTTGSGFVYDDNAIVTYNPLIKSLANLPRIFTTNYWGVDNANSGLYRPLTIASFCLDHALWGLNAAAFHRVNMLWHGLASALAYLLIARVLGRRTPALLAALLFAAHPLHVEAVSGIVGRSEILAACFLFLGAAAHVRYRATGRTRFVAAATIAYVLALLSKETSILFPLLLVALDTGLRLPGRADFVSRTDPRWLRPYAAYAVALVAVYLLRFAVLGPQQLAGPAFVSLMDNPIYEMPPLPRLATAFYVLVRYLGLMAFPLRLSADYSFDQIPAVLGPGDWRAGAALAAFLVFLWLFIRSFRRHEGLFLAVCLFWVPFLPVSNLIVSIGTIMAERMMYLPLLGFALAAALLLERGFDRPRLRRPALGAAALILLALTARTLVRNLDWRDDTTLFTAALEVVPRSSRMRLYLGRHYNLVGDHQAALDNLQRSLEILPRNPETVAEIGHAHIGLGDLDLAEERFREAVTYDPDYVGAYYGLARIYHQRGLYDRALRELRRCVDLVPMHIAARVDVGVVQYAAGDLPAARRSFESVLELDPSSLASEYYLGLMEKGDGNLGGQRERYERAIRTARPFDVDGYNYLGLIYEELGNLESAYANLVVARSLNPLSSFTGTNLARHLIRRGAVTEAVAEAETVLKTNAYSVEALQILGYARILSGRYADAESVLVRAESHRPRDAQTALHLGRLFAAQRRDREAESFFAKARLLNPADPEPLLVQAGFERIRRRFDVARRLVDRARTLRAEPTAVELELARLDAAAGDTAGAAARLDALAAMDIPSPDLRFRLGLAREEWGRLEAADREYRRALEAQPKNGRFLHQRARLLLRAGRPAEAESVLVRLLELHPEHGDGNNALAWALLTKPGSSDADAVRALALAEAAVAADSTRAPYHDTRAEALTRLGRLEEARRARMRAAVLEPSNEAYARRARRAALGPGGEPVVGEPGGNR